MNAPAYAKKDYSYLPQAFQGLQRGAQGMGQGLKTAMDIGDRERKRALEDEFLANLKVTNEQAETVRLNAIADAAAKYKHAANLPDTPEGNDEALRIASQLYHPFTAQELKDGTGVERVHTTEQDILPGIITKTAKKSFEKEYLAGETVEDLGPRREYKEPQGKVGVEVQGEVKQPLSAFPQSKQELQQSAEKELMTQPRLFDTVSTPMTSETGYERMVDLDLMGETTIKELVGKLGKDEAIKAIKEMPEPVYQGPAKRKALEKPTVSKDATDYAETFEKEMTEKEKEQLRIDEIKARKQPTGLATQQDKNITNQQRFLAKLKENRAELIKDVSKMRQLAYKIKEGGEELTLEEKYFAKDAGIRNVDKVDYKEIEKLVYQLQGELGKVDDDINRQNIILDRLTAGESLPAAVAEPPKQKLITESDAQKWIATNLQYLPKGVSSDLVLLKTPPAQKKALQDKVDNAIASGLSKQAIGAWLLGRTKK